MNKDCFDLIKYIVQKDIRYSISIAIFYIYNKTTKFSIFHDEVICVGLNVVYNGNLHPVIVPKVYLLAITYDPD